MKVFLKNLKSVGMVIFLVLFGSFFILGTASADDGTCVYSSKGDYCLTLQFEGACKKATSWCLWVNNKCSTQPEKVVSLCGAIKKQDDCEAQYNLYDLDEQHFCVWNSTTATPPPVGPTAPTTPPDSAASKTTAAKIDDSIPAATADCDRLCQYLKKTHPKPTGYTGPIPDCAFSGTCRDANDLVQLIVNVGTWSFGIIGLVAFAAFVYGGFTMIISFGNAERVKQGRDALVAAVVGIVIAFSAYLIINFVLDALKVKPEFRSITSSGS